MTGAASGCWSGLSRFLLKKAILRPAAGFSAGWRVAYKHLRTCGKRSCPGKNSVNRMVLHTNRIDISDYPIMIVNKFTKVEGGRELRFTISRTCGRKHTEVSKLLICSLAHRENRFDAVVIRST